MKKIIDKKNNQVLYGIYDEKIDFNHKDYVLHNFFDKKVCKLKQKFAFHKFHFIMFSSGAYIIGIAFVDVAIAYNVFGYVYEKDKGVIAEWQKPLLRWQLDFNNDIDHNIIFHDSKSMYVSIHKKTDEGRWQGEFRYKNIIDLKYDVALSLKQKPLRVVNPSDFDHWVFTAKRAGLKLNAFNVMVNGNRLNMNRDNTLCSVDWSAGYFKRDTSWAWGNACTFNNHDILGFNFALFNNNALYPENAVWFNDEREHIEHVLFDWDYKDPYAKGMRIYTSDNRINLKFKPITEKNDIHSRGLGLIKTNFRQFIGLYEGHISINDKKIQLQPFLGLFEIHKAKW